MVHVYAASTNRIQTYQPQNQKTGTKRQNDKHLEVGSPSQQGGSVAEPPSGGSAEPPRWLGSRATLVAHRATLWWLGGHQGGSATTEPPGGGSVAEPPIGGSATTEPPHGGSVAEPPIGGSAATLVARPPPSHHKVARWPSHQGGRPSHLLVARWPPSHLWPATLCPRHSEGSL